MDYIKLLLNVKGKMSTKGADKVGYMVAFALAVAIILVATSVVLWRIAPNGFV